MQFIQRVPIFLLAMAIAGCQATNSAPPGQSFQEPQIPQHGLKYFPDELRDIVQNFERGLVRKCATVGAQASDVDACARKNTADALQTPDVGITTCQRMSDTKQYTECIAIGTMVNQMRLHLSTTHRPEMSASDWLTPEAYLKTLMKGAALDLVDICYDGALGGIKQCIRVEMAKVFEITDHLKQKCDALSDDENYGACLGEAFNIQFLQRAVDRLNAMSS